MTYWVEYRWTYEMWDADYNGWVEDRDFDSGRFHCTKREIRGEVMRRVEREMDLCFDKRMYRKLRVYIEDCFEITDDEL